ncbi:MAG: endonuclease/exonuclease/phosphatase family protein [Planctomycetaceae bacterium]|nr:endonuclease/exonuclease/phosphatase family protein [Planctomycetaceae bacterium]
MFAPLFAQNPPNAVAAGGSGVSPQATSTIRRMFQRLVAFASVMNLLAVITLLVLLGLISEQWWFSTALTYLPRAPYAAPSLLLMVICLLIRRRWIWINLLSLVIVLGPIMGLRIPWAAGTTSGAGPLLTVVTCNLQGGKADLTKIIEEIKATDPDVLVFQEASYGYEILMPFLEGLSLVHRGEYLIAARYPVHLRDICRADAFRRATAILCEIEGPAGPFLVCDVHQTTARHGLAELRVDSLVTGAGVARLQARQVLRSKEAKVTRTFAMQQGEDVPLLVVGDFNMPTSSTMFQQHWRSLTSAFDVAGWGYGYTSPCNHFRRWPSNTPWLRIDHILCNSHWAVERCWIGRTDGSDHRLVAARLRLRESK